MATLILQTTGQNAALSETTILVSPHGKESKTEFWTVPTVDGIPGIGIRTFVTLGFRIPIVGGIRIPWAVFQSPDSQAKISLISESEGDLSLVRRYQCFKVHGSMTLFISG